MSFVGKQYEEACNLDDLSSYYEEETAIAEFTEHDIPKTQAVTLD